MNIIKVLIIYTKLGKLICRNKILSCLLIGRKKRCSYWFFSYYSTWTWFSGGCNLLLWPVTRVKSIILGAILTFTTFCIVCIGVSENSHLNCTCEFGLTLTNNKSDKYHSKRRIHHFANRIHWG